MMGSAAAFDLARDPAWTVTVADRQPERLAALAARLPVRTLAVDVSDPDRLRTLAADCDLALIALPSRTAYRALQTTVEAGRHAVSISFMPEDARALDATARRTGATSVVDCGVAPGLSNMMAGHAAATLDPCDRVDIYVGGVPASRDAPFEFKAAFSPYDVIEEYVDPATVLEAGRRVVKPALSDVEALRVPGVGTLEAFLTDGLRTLLDTIETPFMREKTLRYPGHAGAMRSLRDAGFFSTHPVRVGDHAVRPIDVTAALLFPHWTYREGEPDLTILRVSVVGGRGANRARLTWDLVDRYDPATGLRSMSRTTAFTATVVARLLVEDSVPAGVHPPETIGRLGFLSRVLGELAARGVQCSFRTTSGPEPSG